jgi:hypothetical protein
MRYELLDEIAHGLQNTPVTADGAEMVPGITK